MNRKLLPRSFLRGLNDDGGNVRRKNNEEVCVFQQTLFRLNRSLEVDAVSPLDRHLLQAFDEMSELSKIQVLMTCCNKRKPGCGTGENVAQNDENELSDIEKANQLELVKLKTWIVKVGLSCLFVFSMSVMAALAAMGNKPSEIINDNIDWILKIVKLLLDI